MRRLKAFLLKALTKRTTKPFNAENAKIFVFLRYDRIGDLIVSLPLVKTLKVSFPSTTMILIGSEANAPVGDYCELFDEVIVRKRSELRSWIATLWTLRTRNVSVVFDLNHSVTPHTLFACLAVNPPHVATPYKDGRWGVPGEHLQLFDLMPDRHPNGYDRPISHTYLDIAKELGCSIDPALPYPLCPNLSLGNTENTIILNHRGSRSSIRLVDAHLLEISKIIKNSLPSYKIKLVPERSDYDHIANLTKNLSNVEVMSPNPTIIPVIEAIKTSALVITPDTSLVHIAAAFSKPLIAVYPNTPELFKQWRPLNAAPTVTLFAASHNSLEGYSFEALANAISALTKGLSSDTESVKLCKTDHVK